MKKYGLLLFILTLSIGLAATTNCSFGNFSGVPGSGNAKKETRSVSGFKRIEAGGAVNLSITLGGDFSVSVEADDNLLPLILTETSGDTLKISSKENFSPKTKINVQITMPEITGLQISGASNAVVANVKGDEIDLKASGASKIKITGEAKSVKTDASGASTIDAESLSTENAEADSSGASTIIVAPTGDLNAKASGASSVYYTGEPKNIKQDISGASSIKKK